MFERYTEKARRAIFFARYEASQFGAQQIESEHLLLGLARIMNLPVEALRAEIAQTLPPAAPTSTSQDLPVSHPLKRALAFATEEAEMLGHQHIGPEHLLLGLMRDDHDSIVPGLLTKHGIDRETLLSSMTNTPSDAPVDRDSLKALVNSLPEDRVRVARQMLEQVKSVPLAPPLYSPTSHALKRTMAYAGEEAEKLGHQQIRAEHLLLGLIREGDDSSAAGLLRKHGINRDELLSSLANIPPDPPLTRDNLKALVDSLPEERLRSAKHMLEHMQTVRPMPGRPPIGVEGGWIGQGIGGGGGWNFLRPGAGQTPPGRLRQGRHSRSRIEGGAEVVETHHLREGCEITLIERFRLSEDGKTLSYTQEITGPGKSEQNTIDFEVSQEEGKNPA